MNMITHPHILKLIYRAQLCLCCTSLLLLSTACEDFVAVDPPESQLSGESVFQDKQTVDAALAELYINMRNNGLMCGNLDGLSVLLGNYTDELSYYSANDLPEKDFFQNNLLSGNTTVSSIWNNSYSIIYGANAIIEGLKSAEHIAEQDKEQLLGEALFIRAYIHFFLVNLYGEIPYITTSDYRSNAIAAKSAVADNYIAIAGDLEQAKSLLPEDYFYPGRIRPNKYAAGAFLARVRLYNQQWDLAENESTLLIGNTSMYQLEDNVDNVFLSGSTGTIWQLAPEGQGYNTLEAKTFIFTSGPPPARSLSTTVINSFEQGDLRKSHWTGAVTDGAEVWYFPFKYKENNNTPDSVEYSILLRIEEQVLIRAEARAQQGNLAGALEDLNMVRNRAGLQNSSAGDSGSILEAIYHERQVELFTELGHRFFDLKRLSRLNATLSAVKPGWDEKDALWPIPQSEILLNPNLLPQNEGY